MSQPVPFLMFLVERGLLTRDEASEVMDRAASSSQLLGQLLLRRRILTLRQMIHVLSLQAADPGMRLGELAIKEGYMEASDLQMALAEQKQSGSQHPLDQLRTQKLLSEESLIEALIAYLKRADEPAIVVEI